MTQMKSGTSSQRNAFMSSCNLSRIVDPIWSNHGEDLMPLDMYKMNYEANTVQHTPERALSIARTTFHRATGSENQNPNHSTIHSNHIVEEGPPA